jgi:ketol-acid reductoisomerase
MSSAPVYFAENADPEAIQGLTIAVIGYGNQGKAQALNLRDSGCCVVIGNRDDKYGERAHQDGFDVYSIGEAVTRGDIIILLIPDEVLPVVFAQQVSPNLSNRAMVVFASGYAIAYGQLKIDLDVDVTLLAPRMIGLGVRKRFLTKEGFFCMIGVNKDVTGKAWDKLLALTGAIGGFYKPAIKLTFQQEATMDLFNEQAFGPAFGQVLMTSIRVLLDQGLPPEAVLVEMYMSEEMSYVYKTMANYGLVGQLDFHSQTSQYGAMTRGTRFLNPSLKAKMQKIYKEIDSGQFTREWQSPLSKHKLKVLKFFAKKQKLNRIEQEVRERLKLPDYSTGDIGEIPEDIKRVLQDPEIREQLHSFDSFDEFSY